MKKKILVVDDDDGILYALEAMLETAGYAVETSRNGEGLRHLRKDNLPALILLDVLLSGSDGREICKKLKQSAVTKKVPIIMISADPTVHKGIEDCGADAFLSKPFEMQELLDIVAQHLL